MNAGASNPGQMPMGDHGAKGDHGPMGGHGTMDGHGKPMMPAH